MELDYKLTGGRLSTSTVVMGDGRGSVLATAPLLQTTSPSTTAAQEFDAWGKPISIASKVPRHGYVGFEADAAFGTYTFGRRVYDPTLRRWLSADPLLSANPEVDTEASQLDLWGYAAANPAARTDPTGEVAPALVVAMVVGIMIAFESDTDPVSYTDADTGTTTTYGGADISVPIRRAMQVAGGPLGFAASLYGPYESNTNPSATSATSGAPPSRGYDRPDTETRSGTAMPATKATDDWDDFLGPDQTSIDPRDGQEDPDRIWSSDGTKSVRYGEHEMGSSPTNHHYHKETWVPPSDGDDKGKVENVLQRVPDQKKGTKQ